MTAWSVAMGEALLSGRPLRAGAAVARVSPHDTLFHVWDVDGASAHAALHRPGRAVDEVSRWSIAEELGAALTETVGRPIRALPVSALPAPDVAQMWLAHGSDGVVALLPTREWLTRRAVPPGPEGASVSISVALPEHAEPGILEVEGSIPAWLELEGVTLSGVLVAGDGALSFRAATCDAAAPAARARFAGRVIAAQQGVWCLESAADGAADWESARGLARWVTFAGRTAIAVRDVVGEPARATEGRGDDGDETAEVRR